jgi:hypothetical protein
MYGRLALLALGLAMLPSGSGAATITKSEVGRGRIAAMIRLENPRRDGATVRMRLVNLTGERLENVRVLVTESFRWTDEQHPGPDDPSRATIVTLPDRIAPAATFEATVTLAPPAARAEGRFVLDATVVGLDAYPAR